MKRTARPKVGDKVIENCGCTYKVKKIGRKWAHLESGPAKVFRLGGAKIKLVDVKSTVHRVPVQHFFDTYLLYLPKKYDYVYHDFYRKIFPQEKLSKETKDKLKKALKGKGVYV